MDFKSEFTNIDVIAIHDDAKRRHEQGWRYVQILAVNKDDAIDLIYSYMLDGELDNVIISDVARDAVIPSISDIFLEAFVCENEIHDLFGVAFEGIAIDFLGNFYKVAEQYPMTVITPEQLAAKEKARKIAAAKAAKEAKAKGASDKSQNDANDGAEAETISSEKQGKTIEEEEAELEAKLANMDPEKAAKVRAAFLAKKKKAAEAKEGE